MVSEEVIELLRQVRMAGATCTECIATLEYPNDSNKEREEGVTIILESEEINKVWQACLDEVVRVLRKELH